MLGSKSRNGPAGVGRTIDAYSKLREEGMRCEIESVLGSSLDVTVASNQAPTVTVTF